MGDVKITHIVKWAMACAPLHSRGLAIRSLRCFNKVFVWKMVMEILE